MTALSLGVVIPAYSPDIATLEDYIGDIRQVLSPETIRIEIDTPRQQNVVRLQDIADEINTSNTRRGKGAAIMQGFDSLTTDILVFADADRSVPVSSLEDIILQIINGNAKVSIGSRRHPGSNIISHQTIARRILGDAFAFAARQMLPTKCRDYQCGAKAVHREAWEEIGHHCYEPGFAWDLEFVSVAGALGYEIAEAPVDWADHPDSTVDTFATSIELATALIDVQRRTSAIAESPRYCDTDKTDQTTLTKPDGGAE